MLSDTALTTEDTSSFWGYWNSIKSYIPNLRVLPGKITSLMTKSTTLKGRAAKVNKPTLVDKLSDSGSTLASLLNLSIEVKNKIETYLPDWSVLANQQAGLGAFWIPVSLGMGALAAIAYVSYHGLQLLKDYQTQERIIQGVEKELLSIEQAQKLIKGTVPETRITLPTDTILGSATSTLLKPIGYVVAAIIGIQILAPQMLNFKNWGK